jgi:lactoylglutathione lyase
MKSVEVKIYVNDTEKESAYYEHKLGFHLKEVREGLEGTKEYVFDHEGSDVLFVLASREAAQKVKENTEMPSILLHVSDVDTCYKQLRDNGVQVGELFELGGMKTFNFCDQELNYMACWQA